MKIQLNGIIGWDITVNTIRASLKEADGEDLELEVSSPGGFVYEGLAIFRILQKYKTEHDAKITADIIGLVASMATVIVLVADEITVTNTSIFMIHNVWVVGAGDYKELRKLAYDIEQLTRMVAREYHRKTGGEFNDILRLMDEETFFYGKEIVEQNFGNVYEEIDSDANKDEEIEFAKLEIEEVQNRFSQKEFIDDLHRAVAFVEENILNTDQILRQKETRTMKLEELLQKHPEIQSEIDTMIDESITESRNHVIEVLDVAGVTLKDETKKVILSGGDIGEYAKAELKAHQQNLQEDQFQNLGNLQADTSRKPADGDSNKTAKFVEESVGKYLNTQGGTE